MNSNQLQTYSMWALFLLSLFHPKWMRTATDAVQSLNVFTLPPDQRVAAARDAIKAALDKKGIILPDDAMLDQLLAGVFRRLHLN